MAEIISVNIQKGGCAKTTTVQVLSELLSKENGKKILCIDTDSQCSLTQVSGVNPMDCESNIYTLLKGESDLKSSIVKCRYYDLIPGSPFLANADTEFNKIGKEQFLKKSISDAKYDIIFIDTPPALSLMSIMGLTACNKVIIPAEPSYLAMAGLDQLYETIDTVKEYLNSDISVLGIMIIKYNTRAKLNEVVLEAIEDYANEKDTKVFDTKIRETVKVKEAQSQLTPIVDWASKSTAVEDYRELIKEIF